MQRWACTLQGWTTRSVRSCQREATHNMRSAPDPEMRSTCPALSIPHMPRGVGVWVEEPTARGTTLTGKFVSK